MHPTTFGLRLKSSAPVSLGDLRRLHRVEPFTDPSPAGNCLAHAQLYGTLDAVPAPAGDFTQEAHVWSVAVPAAEVVEENLVSMLVGAVVEFDVAASITTVLQFRTYATATPGVVGLPADEPPGLQTPAHVRGLWPYSSIRLRLVDGVLDMKRVGNQVFEKVGLCDENGPEFSAAQLFPNFRKLGGVGHEFDTPNVGCYGANLEYYAMVNNSDPGEPAKCFVGLVARNTGKKYWGAARVSGPQTQPATVVPKIPDPLYGGQDVKNAVDLLQFDANGAIDLPPFDPGILPTGSWYGSRTAGRPPSRSTSSSATRPCFPSPSAEAGSEVLY